MCPIRCAEYSALCRISRKILPIVLAAAAAVVRAVAAAAAVGCCGWQPGGQCCRLGSPSCWLCRTAAAVRACARCAVTRSRELTPVNTRLWPQRCAPVAVVASCRPSPPPRRRRLDPASTPSAQAAEPVGQRWGIVTGRTPRDGEIDRLLTTPDVYISRAPQGQCPTVFTHTGQRSYF